MKTKQKIFKEEIPNYNGNQLFIDLIPRTSHFKSMRQMIGSTQWDKIRPVVINRAGKQCEICKSNYKLECHERFEYILLSNEPRQILRRLICLCKMCHLSTHIMLAKKIGMYDNCINHIRKLGLNPDQLIREGVTKYEERSKIIWKLIFPINELKHYNKLGYMMLDKKQQTLDKWFKKK